jgi:hypothetical protein
MPATEPVDFGPRKRRRRWQRWMGMKEEGMKPPFFDGTS